MPSALLVAGVLAALVAVASGVADWRSRRRRDLDRIGVLHWPTVQVLALIAAGVCGVLAIRP